MDVPDEPVKLPDGWLACRSCGIAVQRTSDVADEITVEVAYAEQSGGAVSAQNPAKLIEDRYRPRTTLSFALCDAHQRTQELATQLVSEGNHPIYAERMNCALDALSFIKPEEVERVAYLDRDGLNALVARLGPVGQTARWVSRFTPSIQPEADPQTCTRYPFAHLMPGARAELRQAYALLLRERVAKSAPATPIPPPRVGYLTGEIPITQGCLFCGLSHQLVAATLVAQQGRENVARDLWTSKRATTEQLGGPRSPEQLSGHLCRTCNQSVTEVGSLGPTALERALVAALTPSGVGMLGYGGVSISGLVGWGALVARAHQGNSPSQPAPRPGTTPWQHLGDLEAVTEQLKRRLG